MITLQHISKQYGTTHALSDVSIHVQKGELFGLIGPDGAGKTTLMRILTTVLLADSGQALMNDHDVVQHYKKIRQWVGYMPGRFSLYQDLSVEENLKFFATVFGTTIKANYELIADIYSQIEPFKHRLAGRLSGGMKQKLALSCALIHRPKVLILDEPTTGVDAVSRREFWDMLKRLQDYGITILVSTPYMDEASLCNRVALIQKGHIMQVDSPEAIVSNYRHRLLAVSSDDMYRLKQDLEAHSDVHTAFLFGQFLHVSLKQPDTPLARLHEYLVGRGHQHIHIEPAQAGIEDSFMELMLSANYE